MALCVTALLLLPQLNLTEHAQGKSVLLRSLLRETYLVRGSCAFPPPGSTAYVAQDAFIFPASIRANIVLNKPFDPAWYKSVLSACQLDSDLTAMPLGDLTRLGEKGDTLSGGQKQRIVSRLLPSRQSLTRLLQGPCSCRLRAFSVYTLGRLLFSSSMSQLPAGFTKFICHRMRILPHQCLTHCLAHTVSSAVAPFCLPPTSVRRATARVDI